MERTLDKTIGLAERIALGLSALGFFLIMIVIVVDVVLRYVFSAPLSWSYDIISMYLVALIFFFALSDTFRAGAHIGVDLFEAMRGNRFYSIAETIGFIIAIVFFALIFKEGLREGIEGFEAGDVVDGAIAWPTWPPYFICALGVGMLILRIMLAIFVRITALLRGEVYRAPSHLAHEEGVE